MQKRCVRLDSLQTRVTDVGLVGLLHQFRWRCASDPCSSTYAMCVLPAAYPPFLLLIFVTSPYIHFQTIFPGTFRLSL